MNNIVFISGSRSISLLNEDVKNVLDNIMKKGFNVIVGDCWGVDKLVQKYLKEKGYKNVHVYCINRCRNNEGFNYSVVKGNRQVDKDIFMSIACDYGLVIWDGISKGSENNIKRLKDMKKFVKIIRMQIKHNS